MALVMCKVMVIMCVHVDDTALRVGDHVCSHFPKLRYIVCNLTLELYDQDINRHFLHKHSGNKVYILYQVCEKQIKQTNKKKTTSQSGNKSEKYLFSLIIIQQT